MEINNPDQVGKDALMALVVSFLAVILLACITSCTTTLPTQTTYDCEFINLTHKAWKQK